MPTKFVTNSAERAGVSVETAERRWHEAKKAVHKGKRRGSWYWGKVVNTFKRMMGLIEATTFKDFLLIENDDEDEEPRWSPTWADFPRVIRLYGPYAAIMEREGTHDGFRIYRVHKMLEGPTGVTLMLSDYGDEAVAWTVGLNRDYTQKLGVNRREDEARSLEGFREWAVDSLKGAKEQLKLDEGLSIPKGLALMPERIMLKNGYYLEKFDVKPTKAIFRVLRLLDDSVYGRLYFVRRGGDSGKYMWQLQKPGNHAPGSPYTDGGPVATWVISTHLYPNLTDSDVAFDRSEMKDFVVKNMHLLPLLNNE